MDRYIVCVPIIRSNYNVTSSAKFKGSLCFVSNQYGIIYDWKIEFTELFIDLYSTSSWFDKKNKNFQRREVLFSMLNLKQEKRESQKVNKIVQLNAQQLYNANLYFNDRSKYNSTLKNIIAVIKGNNPCGEAKKPKSAEIIIDSEFLPKNFVILIDDLCMTKLVDYNAVAIGAKQISFEQFISLNKDLTAAFSFMQNEKNKDSWLFYLNNIRKYYRQYNDVMEKAHQLALNERQKFSIKIDKEIIKLPFEFVSSSQFQKCHIYEFHDLRDEIILAMKNGETYQKYLDMISDVNNFLPLTNEIHRQFDKNNFTYKPDGEIWAINDEGYNFIQKFVPNKFKKIPSWFLNDKRVKYIKLRNANIIW